MAAECLLRAGPDSALEVRLRFLQLQNRSVERAEADGSFTPVAELTCADTTWVSWDEAVPLELAFGPFALAGLRAGKSVEVSVQGGEDVETLHDSQAAVVGRLVRRRWPLAGELRLIVVEDAGLVRLRVSADNRAPEQPTEDKGVRQRGARKDRAIARRSSAPTCCFRVSDGAFVSLLEPPDDAVSGGHAASSGGAGRCWRRSRETPTSCSRRRSSCTTTPRSRRRAPARCSTPPRSTRSSPCA
jgi:hypothetical protein